MTSSSRRVTPAIATWEEIRAAFPDHGIVTNLTWFVKLAVVSDVVSPETPLSMVQQARSPRDPNYHTTTGFQLIEPVGGRLK
jgi:hypothetical protein